MSFLTEKAGKPAKQEKESYADSVSNMSKADLINEEKNVSAFFDANQARLDDVDSLMTTLKGRKGLKKDVENIEDAISLGLSFMGENQDNNTLFDANEALKNVLALTQIEKGTVAFSIVEKRLKAEFYLRMAKGKLDIVQDELARRS